VKKGTKDFFRLIAIASAGIFRLRTAELKAPRWTNRNIISPARRKLVVNPASPNFPSALVK